MTSPIHAEESQVRSRITSDPGILAGKPCIRGLRIRVVDILEMLAHGATRKEILNDFPCLEDGDITAALAYAIDAVHVGNVLSYSTRGEPDWSHR